MTTTVATDCTVGWFGRVAYADEFPWVRCPCGSLISDTAEPQPCSFCGETATVTYLDRFGPPGTPYTEKYGKVFAVIPYEDRYRFTQPQPR